MLGNFFGVTRRTIQNWIATHPDFADAVYRGRAVAEIRAKKIRTDRLLLQFEKALLPVTVILIPAMARKNSLCCALNRQGENAAVKTCAMPASEVPDWRITCGNCGNCAFLPATTPAQRGCYSVAMTDSPLPDQIPDRLSTNPKSPHYDEALLTRGVGIKFDGQEKTNVEEYCVSEGWIRVAVGKTVDRKGNPLTIKLTGKVEPYFQKP